MALTKISTDGFKDDAVTTDKLANAINTERTANTAKVSTTINNNADNRVITGSGTANTLEGESNIHINGGTLIAGHTASTTTSNGEGPFIQAKGTDSRAGASFIRHSADAAGSGLYIGKSRNATIGSNTVVQDDDELGRITFSGDDGTDINTVGVEIAAHVDGTPGSNDMPGRLTFRTTADGAAGTTERMRITSDGDVGIGTSSPNRLLYVSQSSTASYNSTGEGGSDNHILRIHNPNGTDNTGVNNHTGLEFVVSSGANSHGYLGLVRTGNNVGDFFYKTRTGGNSYAERFRILNGGGITFNGDTAAANALDDYEVGNYSPVGTGGSGTTSVTFHSNESKLSYVKIGRMVTVFGRVRINDNNYSGTFQLSLPFASAAGDDTDNVSMSAVATHGFNFDNDGAGTGHNMGAFWEVAQAASIMYLVISRDDASWIGASSAYLKTNSYLGVNITYKAA